MNTARPAVGAAIALVPSLIVAIVIGAGVRSPAVPANDTGGGADTTIIRGSTAAPSPAVPGVPGDIPTPDASTVVRFVPPSTGPGASQAQPPGGLDIAGEGTGDSTGAPAPGGTAAPFAPGL